jgi:hypothetical protein
MIFEQLQHEYAENDPDRFIKRAKELVAERRNDDAPIFVVWFSKTLKNWKVQLSTDVPDGLLYEVTYDGNKQAAYVDTYSKVENVEVPDPKPVEDPGLRDLPDYPITRFEI